MILWSIQDEDAYNSLKENEVLRCGADHQIMFSGFEKAYGWMMQKMREHIGTEPQGVFFPIWAWYQWEGKRKRLDMRTHRFCGKQGKRIVLLSLDVPEENVLLSDFDDWHYVLSDSFLGQSSDEDGEYSEDEKEYSWNEIVYENSKLSNCNKNASIQACMWELKIEWVKQADIFTGRS